MAWMAQRASAPGGAAGQGDPKRPRLATLGGPVRPCTRRVAALHTTRLVLHVLVLSTVQHAEQRRAACSTPARASAGLARDHAAVQRQPTARGGARARAAVTLYASGDTKRSNDKSSTGRPGGGC